MGNIREDYKVEPKKEPKREKTEIKRSDDSAFLAEEMFDLRDIEKLDERE